MISKIAINENSMAFKININGININGFNSRSTITLCYTGGPEMERLWCLRKPLRVRFGFLMKQFKEGRGNVGHFCIEKV